MKASEVFEGINNILSGEVMKFVNIENILLKLEFEKDEK